MGQPDLAYAIGLPPEAAIAYLEGKGYAIGFSWRDVWQEAHAKAFTAAGVMKVEVLADLRNGLGDALKNGETREDFIRKLTPTLQRKGWWGINAQTNTETGEMAGKGLTPRRLQTIFDTNMQSAYMAGRYKAFMGNVADRPYWMYVAIMDKRTRPAHAALNGRTFRYDDPVWDAIWPPNGFRCRCSVRALDNEDLKSRGIDLSSSAGKLSEVQVATSRQPGAPTATVTRFEYAPGRYFQPDPGFNYNAGKVRAQWDANAARPDCGGANGAVAFAEDGCLKRVAGKAWFDYGRVNVRDVPKADRLLTPTVLPRAADRSAALGNLAAALGVSAAAPLRAVQTPIETVVLDYAWLPHLVEKAEAARERYAHFVLPTLMTPFEVWMVEYEDGLRRRYIGLFEEADLMLIVRVNRDGSLLWNALNGKPDDLNRQRSGVLLYPGQKISKP